MVKFLGGWLALWLPFYAATWGVHVIASPGSLADDLSDFVTGPPFLYGIVTIGCLSLGSLAASVVIFKVFRDPDAPLLWRGVPAWLLAWGLCVGVISLFHLALMSIDIGPGGP